MCAALLASASTTALAAGTRQAPPRATVVEVQQLFHALGYPLGYERTGTFGVRTRGAVSYFQRKYGLPVTGYPDARTIARMRSAVASLRSEDARDSTPRSHPHDLVERTFGGGVPFLALAIGLAVALSLLALSTKRKAGQASPAAGETSAEGWGES